MPSHPSLPEHVDSDGLPARPGASRPHAAVQQTDPQLEAQTPTFERGDWTRDDEPGQLRGFATTRPGKLVARVVVGVLATGALVPLVVMALKMAAGPSLAP